MCHVFFTLCSTKKDGVLYDTSFIRKHSTCSLGKCITRLSAQNISVSLHCVSTAEHWMNLVTPPLYYAIRYWTKYKKSWGKKYDFVKPSSHSDSHYFCTVCQKDVSIKHQGALDLQRHSASDTIHDQVTAAEIRNTVIIAHPNAALCLADHKGPMLRASITDSQIVKGYHCARTKTACILNYALALYLIDELVSSMKQMSYSLSVDGSNDTGLSKMNPLTVRIYDANEKVVLQKILDLCLTTGANASKANDIFDAINSVVGNE